MVNLAPRTALDRISFRWVLAAGLLWYLATALYNIGIIAMDDYDSSIAPVVPAQSQSPKEIVKAADFRSPLPGLTLFALSSVGLKLGLIDPAAQFRFVLLVLGLFSFAMNTSFARYAFRLSRAPSDEKETVVVFLLGLYFLCPLFLTRPLIEALSAPFLTASAYYASRYYVTGERSGITRSLVFLTVASMYRFQAGICALALFILVLIKWKDVLLFLKAGVVCFLASGFIDYLMKGQFHGSLLGYVRYNVAYSSTYGTPPFYAFIVLFLGLSLPPTFFSRYRGLRWREEYAPLIGPLLYFLFFVAAHSIVPHKEERFMIPVLPLFMILLTPLAYYFLQRPKERWRVIYFLSLNGLLLIPVSFNIPQNNIVGLARYLNAHAEFDTVVGVGDTLVLFPKAFTLNPIQEKKINADEIPLYTAASCRTVLAVRLDVEMANQKELARFERIAEFSPGFLEAWVVKLNPRNNARRGPIGLFWPAHCASRH